MAAILSARHVIPTIAVVLCVAALFMGKESIGMFTSTATVEVYVSTGTWPAQQPELSVSSESLDELSLEDN